MKNIWYLFFGYLAIWAMLGGYIFWMGSKVNELGRRIARLENTKN